MRPRCCDQRLAVREEYVDPAMASPIEAWIVKLIGCSRSWARMDIIAAGVYQ